MHAFVNTPPWDFRELELLEIQRNAIEKVRNILGKKIRFSLPTAGKVISTNPFRPQEMVVEVDALSAKAVEQQITAASQAFERWRQTPVSERIQIMEAIAEQLEQHRAELNAWMILEVGKPWAEADADTCEAIDFVRYYAQSMQHWITNPHIVQGSTQTNEMHYIPLGVGAVIAPWNFPLAILCGMTVASLVTGNTVLMKPSSDAVRIGMTFHKILLEAGVPPDVVQLVVGHGSEVGNVLVRDPRIRFVCFTGSREVGVHIYAEGAKVQRGQIWLKRMILEMGGKDGIFVDETADLDAAAQGVVASAFGYSGQKCSACSRLIVHRDVKGPLLEKILALTARLHLGDPADPATDMGPVVNASSFEKNQRYITIGKDEGKLLCGGDARPEMGYMITPTIFDGISERHRLFQEEIFGPVLAVTEAKDFADGIRLMNATEYGLTGSVYTSDPERIRHAKEEVHVGNLYINRKCTGALVGQHPFGGFNMSGTDSKAGGPDYLLQFLQPKSIAQLVS